MEKWKVSEIYEPDKLNINQWDADDRPRERLMKCGAEALSNAELLAILIGSGNQKENAVDLMKRVLKDCSNNLALLSKRSIEQLMTYSGIGEAKAITILAACELGRRREHEEMPQRTVLDSSEAMYKHLLMTTRMRDLDVEEAYVILMNNAFKHLATIQLSHGGITETAVDVRVIIKHALHHNATVIAIAHNHPSGNVKPSRDDERLTKQVNDACHTMRIHFCDHLIVTDGNYYSFRDEGKL